MDGKVSSPSKLMTSTTIAQGRCLLKLMPLKTDSSVPSTSIFRKCISLFGANSSITLLSLLTLTLYGIYKDSVSLRLLAISCERVDYPLIEEL